MKKIGILGGLGPEATIDYYKRIIEKCNRIRKNNGLNYPEIIIYSVNMSKFIGLLEDHDYEAASTYIAENINNLKRAGADFAVISANTPHLLFHEIEQKVNLRLISIVRSCAQKAKDSDLKKCGLLGTKFTMQNDFYNTEFSKFGIEIITPEDEDIGFIHKKLFTELELGIYKKETQTVILSIIQNMKERKKIDSVILGCTEFPIMFPEEAYLDIPFLNTTQVHVDSILKESLKEIYVER